MSIHEFFAAHPEWTWGECADEWCKLHGVTTLKEWWRNQ